MEKLEQQSAVQVVYAESPSDKVSLEHDEDAHGLSPAEQKKIM